MGMAVLGWTIVLVNCQFVRGDRTRLLYLENNDLSRLRRLDYATTYSPADPVTLWDG